jgi:molybdate/tungstate transport system substrate-binding protein
VNKKITASESKNKISLFLNNLVKNSAPWKYDYVLNQGLLTEHSNKKNSINDKNITIFLAGSLILPIQELTKKFKTIYPHINFKLEASGSLIAARKITELNRETDLFFSADYNVIKKLMYPEYAHFCINFALGEMVIAFTDRSKSANLINSLNWFNILLEEDVNFGRSDPDCDPAGYRTLMLWKLADKYYSKKTFIFDSLIKKCPQKNVRPGSIQLLPLLESMWLDYCFEYRSVAEQHNLRYIKLPPEINLSKADKNYLYSSVSINLKGKNKKLINMKGENAIYSFTIIPSSLENETLMEFIKFFFSLEGEKIFKKNQQPLISPELITFDKI